MNSSTKSQIAFFLIMLALLFISTSIFGFSIIGVIVNSLILGFTYYGRTILKV